MRDRISIIVVSYNRFEETTGPCVASLVADPLNRETDIIVVDNNSTDGTADRVRDLGEQHSQIRAILNDGNRGFAGGNNDGAELAAGEILLLLNSDTIVPPGAVARLTELMNRNTDWAMLGPVTNQAGNEQKIFTRGNDLEGILEEGERWCANAGEDVFPSVRLDFFCVAIRKSVYERFGGLDERFGVGYYEDTDFSQQVLSAGLPMMFTEEVFVYHQAGQSFSKIGSRRVKQLMRENKKKLMRKHNRKVKLLHMRQCNAMVLKRYAAQNADTYSSAEGLRYRFENRMAHARQMVPNSPFKKLKYAWQLKRIQREFYR